MEYNILSQNLSDISSSQISDEVLSASDQPDQTDQTVDVKNRPIPICDVNISADSICKLEKNRRSVTTNSYGVDTICNDAITTKQANFLTDHPLRWFDAISKYITDGKLINRCERSSRK